MEGQTLEERKEVTRLLNEDEFISWYLEEELSDVVGPMGQAPVVSLELKDEIYQLHKSDPIFFNATTLGRKYNIETAKVRAILHLQQLQAEAEEEDDVMPETVDRLFEARFGTHIPEEEEFEAQDFNYENKTAGFITFIDDEQDSLAVQKRILYKPPPMSELPPTAPIEFPNEPLLIKRAERSELHKSRILFYDHNKHIPLKLREILVCDERGNTTTPSWEEKRMILNPIIRARSPKLKLIHGVAKFGVEELQTEYRHKDQQRINEIGFYEWSKEQSERAKHIIAAMPEEYREDYFGEESPAMEEFHDDRDLNTDDEVSPDLKLQEKTIS